MNRAFVQDNYGYLTGKASDIVRQLAFAGIAVVWIFRITDTTGRMQVPPEFVKVAFGCVVSLSLDLLQYLVASVFWGVFGCHLDRKGVKADDEFAAPGWINWPALLFFWGKSAVIVLSYVLLLKTLWGYFHP